jgi:fructose-bisphosphate aldolase class II
MNIDTDTQWAFWDGIRAYEAKNHDYLQGQIGNPESPDKPNKKYYDPRMSLRSAEGGRASLPCCQVELRELLS